MEALRDRTVLGPARPERQWLLGREASRRAAYSPKTDPPRLLVVFGDSGKGKFRFRRFSFLLDSLSQFVFPVLSETV